VRDAYVAGDSWAVVVTAGELGGALAGRFWGRRALGALLGRWVGAVTFFLRTLGGATDDVVVEVGTVGTLGSVGRVTVDVGTLGGATVSAGFGHGVLGCMLFHWVWSVGLDLLGGS
jgi:hypothetical protein